MRSSWKSMNRVQLPAGVSFAKMYVKSVASNTQSMVFAQGEVAVHKTQHLVEGR